MITAMLIALVATNPAGLASDNATMPPPATAAATRPVEEAKADTKRYCIVDASTRSRISRRKCQTREAWLRQGQDPLVK